MNWLRLISVFSLTILVVPVFLLIYEGFGPLSEPIGYSYEVFRAIELTLISSAVSSAISVAVFTPLAYYLARNKNSLFIGADLGFGGDQFHSESQVYSGKAL